MLKILNLNVFRGFHTQTHKIYKWEYRRDLILNLVNHVSPDIILFQECNQLQNDESMEKFMTSLPKYRYSIYYSHPNFYRSRALIIAYDPNKVFKIEEITKWLSDTPDTPSDTWGTEGDDFGRLIAGNKFVVVNDQKMTEKSFWVFNTHFDVNLTSITKSISLVPSLINKLTNNESKVIVAGDFNIDSVNLIKSFNDAGFSEYSNNFESYDRIPLNFTFVGKRNNKGILDDFMYLDHVFGKGIDNFDVYCPYTWQYIRDEYIVSDHLPIMFVFEM
ncbi:putative endonuclease/exonuclease/phosphatase [Tupanvirus deep ocean]|uniref:Endonuclease/exonuclease/phosphatase n=2 Tax=Tupanvirus TaxID=2094720 RepID=A0AC62A8D1_9VIRU|nr:putative endonuclease/exonuclease/phosphatase [Tupanvirus deep ocean]QKU33979.1 putative endonuclease/exonuclease/phosphatase [Tupanvirus deep ocean]